MGRNERQRTVYSGERGDEAPDARAPGQFRDTSSMGPWNGEWQRHTEPEAVFSKILQLVKVAVPL